MAGSNFVSASSSVNGGLMPAPDALAEVHADSSCPRLKPVRSKMHWEMLAGCFLVFMIQAICCADPDMGAEERITYVLENFESFCPGGRGGRREAQGRSEVEIETVHGGERAARLHWDLSRSPDNNNCFFRFDFNRLMIGRPTELRVWIHADERVRGAALAFYFHDTSGECYIRRTAVDWTGWKQAEFPLHGCSPAWSSGDNNQRQDPPMKAVCLAIDYSEPLKGSIVVDDIEVITLATPREALHTRPSLDRYYNWGDVQPVFRVPVRNYSGSPVGDVRCEIEVKDVFHERVILSKTIRFDDIPAGRPVEKETQLTVPYGMFDVGWTLADGAGTLRRGGTSCQRLLPKCYQDIPEAVKRYDFRWSMFGGVFGSICPQLASDMGARWIRFEDPDWRSLEPKRGRFRMGPFLKRHQDFHEAGIDRVVLQTFYDQPSFHTTKDLLDFASAYGQVMNHEARATKSLTKCFELGNEDNGPTKFIYTEIARHGAAGVRSEQPHALIANSGTAYIDVSWVKLQADRGLFDWLDAVCVHPYTGRVSAEKWDVYGQLDRLNDVIDALGGMKRLWTTEFGWHHTFSQRLRAQWIPRHYLIGGAVGVERHGLYTWKRDYGIIEYPAAVSVHALARLLEGHRFVGLLAMGDKLWASVWERAGRPMLAAWSPTGEAEYAVDVTPDSQVLDLFGNPRAAERRRGRVTLRIDGSATYVTTVAASVLRRAALIRCTREQERFAKCLEAAGRSTRIRWKKLGEIEPTDAVTLRKTIVAWTPSGGTISVTEQAVVAQALRWYLIAGRYFPDATRVPDPSAVEDLESEYRTHRARHEAAEVQDLDVPSLRFLLEAWDRLQAEESVARAYDAASHADRLLAMRPVLSILCRRFGESGERKLFALWPYLYALDRDGAAKETLRLVPGSACPVRARVSSYARRDYDAQLTLRLPSGWMCHPPSRRLQVKAGTATDTTFAVTCAPGTGKEKPRIRAVLEVPGKPAVTLRFDDIEIVPAVKVECEPVQGLLPETPLKVRLTNIEATPVSGVLRILAPHSAGRALARTPFSEIPPGRDVIVELTVKTSERPAYSEWPLEADVLLKDGRRFRQKLTVDFLCAVQATAPPEIDGDLSDWADATPIHLAQKKYARGSYGGRWTPEDCSCVSYVKWDPRFMYFAARVTDQTFNQQMARGSLWTQDSIQIIFARDTSRPFTEFTIALTPKGESVWKSDNARAKILVGPNEIIYEAAIPWSDMNTMGMLKPGNSIRYGIAVNDDDAIIGRRFLERFIGSIVHGKDVNTFGEMILLGPGGDPSQTESKDSAEPGAILLEDFEEYEDGTLPDTWRRVVHKSPVPEGAVRAGAGRDGSKALVFANRVGKPYHYLNLVRCLEKLTPGTTYALRVWVRGKGVTEPSRIIGVCSDIWGNETHSYAAFAPAEEWQQIVWRFRAPLGGAYNVILRNLAPMDLLVIDDLKIAPVRQ